MNMFRSSKNLPFLVKHIHNVRITSTAKEAHEGEELLLRLEELMDMDLKKHVEYETLTHPGLDPLYTTKFWFDKQPLIKAFLQLLKELSDEDKQELQDTVALRLDERQRYFFRLDKEAFLSGKMKVVLGGDVLQVRLNVAAYPNRSNVAQKVVEDLFQQMFK